MKITTKENSVIIDEREVPKSSVSYDRINNGIQFKSGVAGKNSFYHYSAIEANGVKFNSAQELYDWLSENFFDDGGGGGVTGPQQATLAEVQAGEDVGKYVNPYSLSQIVNGVNVLTDDSVTLDGSGSYTFNGGEPVTWTLKAVEDGNGETYSIKNRGDAVLTVTGDLYFTSPVGSIQIAPGDAVILHNDTETYTVN